MFCIAGSRRATRPEHSGGLGAERRHVLGPIHSRRADGIHYVSSRSVHHCNSSFNCNVTLLYMDKRSLVVR